MKKYLLIGLLFLAATAGVVAVAVALQGPPAAAGVLWFATRRCPTPMGGQPGCVLTPRT